MSQLSLDNTRIAQLLITNKEKYRKKLDEHYIEYNRRNSSSVIYAASKIQRHFKKE